MKTKKIEKNRKYYHIIIYTVFLKNIMDITKQKLDEYRSYALGDDDIENILGKNIFIFTYPYLDDVDSIDKVFDSQGRSMMLFLTEDENTGHWICMIKRGNVIEYFDPYGTAPDADMKWLNNQTREKLDEVEPRLSELMRKSGYEINYNLYPFQASKDHINTCGRWSSMRLYYKDMTLKEFYQMVMKGCKKNKLSQDEYICLLSSKILGK
jgi:hypothetical protein